MTIKYVTFKSMAYYRRKFDVRIVKTHATFDFVYRRKPHKDYKFERIRINHVNDTGFCWTKSTSLNHRIFIPLVGKYIYFQLKLN